MSVLIADDDRITTRVLEKHLRMRGYEVRVVHAGGEAGAALESETPPLVAVLDWTMPGTSGPELCRRVRARAAAPFVYLVLLTGRDHQVDVTEGLDAGADEYLKKPFDLADVLERVTRGMVVARARRDATNAPLASSAAQTHRGPMETTRLGRTGLQVSRLCLGTMNFGPHTPERESFQIMDRALAQGVQFFDTANVYGQSAGRGATEQIVGNWFAQGERRREQVVLATKVYARMGDGVNDAKLSARHIKLACEDSLRRLQTDWIDLYQMHHIDRDTPWDEIWQAMELLVQQGKVLYVGSSNFAGWHIAKAMETARRRGSLGLVSEQSLYHLNARTIELEVIPACRDYGLGLLPWSPLGGGLLGGILGKLESGRRTSDFAQERLAKARPKIEAYERLCAEIGHPPGEVALAWLLHNPIVTAPIIGPRTMEQFESALRSTSIKLSDEVLKKLDQIFPPKGEAPEAYAW